MMELTLSYVQYLSVMVDPNLALASIMAVNTCLIYISIQINNSNMSVSYISLYFITLSESQFRIIQV